MDESILDSIKKPLGLEPDYTEFDADVIMFINGNLMNLAQNGVGKVGFRIIDNTATWSDFLDYQTDVEDAKTYVYLKTRIVFDPPSSSSVLEAYQKEAEECLWRCMIQVEEVREDDDSN